MLRFSDEQIVWQEVPGEVSLAFTITGCKLGCKGCHSAHSWPEGSGEPLSADYLQNRLLQYNGLITCVLFLGGEWQPDSLISLLKQVRTAGLHRCLYTGLDSVPVQIKQHLTFLKTGRWMAELGGLDNPDTNQQFIDLRTDEQLNYRFIRQ